MPHGDSITEKNVLRLLMQLEQNRTLYVWLDSDVSVINCCFAWTSQPSDWLSVTDVLLQFTCQAQKGGRQNAAGAS